MGKLIGFIPAEFLRKEPFAAAVSNYLWQATGITKVVGKKCTIARNSKPLTEGALTLHHLTQEAFTVWQVEVGFYPHATHWFPSSFANKLRNLGKDVRRVFSNPRVMLSLAMAIHGVWILFQKVNCVCKRADSFAASFTNGP